MQPMQPVLHDVHDVALSKGITYSQGLLDLWWRSAKAPSAGSLQTP